MKTSVIGYPRIGGKRELKFWTEDYFGGKIGEDKLLANAKELRAAQWQTQRDAGIDFISSNDFSFYDGALDTAALLNIIPKRYRDLRLNELQTYFAMARGYQGENGDVKALSMRKWFNTNYHYIVPEIDDGAEIKLVGDKPFAEFAEAKQLGVRTKPVLVGPFTLLKLAKYTGEKKTADFADAIIAAYAEILKRFSELSAEWVQLDEPILVTDLSVEEIALFTRIYTALLAKKGALKILLQTYFGDVRDCYREIQDLPFDGVGLDFVEGKQSLELVKRFGFSNNKILFAGLINGKNIWKNRYENTLRILNELSGAAKNITLSTSCSLLHVPYTVDSETELPGDVLDSFAFAQEKLNELAELGALAENSAYESDPIFAANSESHQKRRKNSDEAVTARVAALTEKDYTRVPGFDERAAIQKNALKLPLLPTTTIGSFPQTNEVKQNRADFRKGEKSYEDYFGVVKNMTARWIGLQEELGLDVLVHGEFERNDMVEYFGENLSGFRFTKFAWVQSYGTRCVKPPIVFGDVKREKAFTVDIISYANSLTDKPVKGMLTGPATILNWSFPREDITAKESMTQIALAIRDEVLDLEAAGVSVIQVDEAALREKLPLRKADWHSEYLDYSIPAFRLVHSGVKPETQIHTHMCYSEFQDIIADIDAMDADVISFEAARSNLAIVDAIKKSGFKTAVGPGVYDIHSPRVPSVEEIEAALRRILNFIPKEKLWVNPDCGLKTRGEDETLKSLRNLVAAAKAVRENIGA
jgi:5-methyltetrahydropteroyltriglutamate--homocysteine methyltransferase